jgi:hypothetical protein
VWYGIRHSYCGTGTDFGLEVSVVLSQALLLWGWNRGSECGTDFGLEVSVVWNQAQLLVVLWGWNRLWLGSECSIESGTAVGAGSLEVRIRHSCGVLLAKYSVCLIQDPTELMC